MSRALHEADVAVVGGGLVGANRLIERRYAQVFQ